MTADEDEPLSGPTDSIKPWTIKAIATDTRDTAIAAARREGLTVGQWLERRVREWTAGEAAGEQVLQVANQGKPNQLAIVPARAATVPATLTELTEAVRVSIEIAKAAGVQVPAALPRDLLAAVRVQVRAARGLPPAQPRKAAE
jgi:hypothetical protein